MRPKSTTRSYLLNLFKPSSVGYDSSRAELPIQKVVAYQDEQRSVKTARTRYGEKRVQHDTESHALDTIKRKALMTEGCELTAPAGLNLCHK